MELACWTLRLISKVVKWKHEKRKRPRNEQCCWVCVWWYLSVYISDVQDTYFIEACLQMTQECACSIDLISLCIGKTYFRDWFSSCCWWYYWFWSFGKLAAPRRVQHVFLGSAFCLHACRCADLVEVPGTGKRSLSDLRLQAIVFILSSLIIRLSMFFSYVSYIDLWVV